MGKVNSKDKKVKRKDRLIEREGKSEGKICERKRKVIVNGKKREKKRVFCMAKKELQ